MPYQLQCTDCYHQFGKSYLSLSRRCPRCKSSDVAMIVPSRKTGRIVFAIGMVLLALLLGDLCLFLGGGAGHTVIGTLVKSIFGATDLSALIYFIVTILYGLLVAAVIVQGFGIAFGKHINVDD